MDRSLTLKRRLASGLLWGVAVLSATALSCSRVATARTDTLFEATGLATLRIDEATVAKAAGALGVSAADARPVGDGRVVELRVPPFLVLSFAVPEGGGEARLYAARAALWEPVYTGKTSKGIGFLDSVETMHEVYGPPETVWVSQNESVHYYPEEGVIFRTVHPRDFPKQIYAKARAALGKEPDEGPTAHVVVAIMVVRPFTVTKAAERAMVRQQVVSTRPETDLLVSVF
jgi:hypothetical protein